MAATPTISELKAQIKSYLETELGFTITVFGKVFLNALAAVQAAKLKLLYLLVADVRKNVWVDTAYSVSQGGTLERFGIVKLGRPPFTATQGEYTVQVTGTIGQVVPAGTQFKTDDNSSSPGKFFILDSAKTLTAGTDTMTLRALEAGLDSRLIVGDTLTAVSPLVVNDQVEVTVESVIPLDAENLETYRDLVIRAFQLESQGGAATDYRAWATDAQGVAAIYPYAKSGVPAELEIYVEATNADSTDGNGTPSAQLLLDVEEVIEFDPDTSKPLNERGRRPLGVFNIDFIAVSPLPVVIAVNGQVGIDSDTQTAIESAIKTAIDNVRPFVEAADILENKNDILSVNQIIFIIQDILVSGQTFSSLTMTVDGNPVTSSFQFSAGNIPYLDSITYP